MYSKQTVEKFLSAREDGMTLCEAAEFAGITFWAARCWSGGRLPHSYTGARAAAPRGMKGTEDERGKARHMPDKRLCAPPRSGPLAGLNPDQMENLPLGAVLADLKAGGWDPASISNRSKCELGGRLGRETGLPLRSITGFLRISKSSYEHRRARLAGRGGRDADIRARVVGTFRQGNGMWGYRTVWARMRRAGTVASEKRVLRVMRGEGLRPVYVRRRRRGHGSYVGEVSKAPDNLLGRDFHADAPDGTWPADVTEFRLPRGPKVYLSPVIDCFDGKPVAWSIGTRPTKELANSSLEKAIARRGPGAATTIHSDRGGRYRWPGWIRICEENDLAGSMSAKGRGPDNAACEGFFGRLRNGFFYFGDWSGVGADEFMAELDAYLEYYCEGRVKRSLGWMSPNECRGSLGYEA